MPDWGMSAVGPGFDTGGDTQTTTTTRTTTRTTTTGTGSDSGGDTSGDNSSTGKHPCDDGPRNGDNIRNGDFELGLVDWQVVDIKKKGANRVEVTDDPDCGQVLTFTRTNSGNDGGMSAVAQTLDVGTDNLEKLNLRLVAFVASQELSGDGWYGGETPVFVTVDYVTTGGAAKAWSHGLSVSGPIKYPDRDQVIPAREWYTWDSPDLLKELPDLDRVTKVTIGGSGWDFQSRIGRVWLRSY